VGKRFEGDFDGDGKPDILIQTNTGQDLLISKTGRNKYSAKLYYVGQSLSSYVQNGTVELRDFNSDGSTDIVKNDGTVRYAQEMGFSAQYEQGEYVGSLAGEHNVTPSGEFTYSMPLTTAPATGNFIPGIALNYSSGGPIGHMGRGWSISGFRLITRCEQNLELNGTIRKVDFSNNDRFCLDGQQLIAHNGATYGGNNVEYRTVQNNFEKVISKTSSGVAGPASFEAVDTSGTTYYFGRVGIVNDALILTSNNQAYVWALKKVQDASGNYYTFNYSKVNSSLEFFLTSVHYTGNAGLSPTNEFVFSYEEKPSPDETTYIAGQTITLSKRLTSITSKANGVVLRKYTLDYYGDDDLDWDGLAGAHQNLASITACDNAHQCLTPTRFSWNSGYVNGEYGGEFSRTSRYKGHQMWDYNGDGLLDIAYVRNDRGNSTDHLFLIQNTGSSLIERQRFNDIAGENFRKTWKIVDLNKDGKDEIIYRGNNGLWYQIKHNGSGFTNTSLSIPAASQNAYSNVVDMDGDGLAELLQTVNLNTGNNVLAVQRGTKTGFSSTAEVVQVNLNSPGSNYTVGLVPYDREDNTMPATDFNGDGRSDFIVQVRQTYTDPNPDPGPCTPGQICYEPLSTSYQQSKSLINDSAESGNLHVLAETDVVPVNHYVEQPAIDTKTSLQPQAVSSTSSTSTVFWKILTSNSHSSLSEYATIGQVAHFDKVIPVDINGDGLADIAYRKSGNK
jgi:hypothetical protein